MERWELPELYCPFPSLVNRHADVVGQATIEWAGRHGLLTEPNLRYRLEAVRVGWLIARTNPTTSLDALQLLADWCTWLFLQDDQCDERGIGKDPEAVAAIHGRSYEVLSGAPLRRDDRPLTRALVDLRQRFMARARPGWMDRFLQSVVNSFQASIWEAQNRARGIIPDMDSYLEHRPFTGGVYTLVETIELTEQLGLPYEIYEDPYIQRLVRRAVNVVCWSNDIVSLAKEIKQGDVHNLVLVLQHRHGISLQDAVYRAAALHDAEVRAFMDLEAELPSFGEYDSALRHYIMLQKAWMKGNLDWSYMSGRYLLAQLSG
jgi:hypothetical protein